MCGIMGYVGPRPAAPLLLGGLRRLEYRGYDSAGIAVGRDGAISVLKTAGKLDRLADLLDGDAPAGTTGIGHTRWATHGRPTDANAHPHRDPTGEFVLVHNGIIENFYDLREELRAKGNEFTSETDTEVLVHLIAEEYDGDLAAAVRRAVDRAQGAYALVVMTTHEPGTLVAVRMISPLVVGLGDGETFLASDIPALLDHTRDILIVEDGELVTITAGAATVETLAGETVDRKLLAVEWDVAQAERGGYRHFMLKEIHEQPTALAETMRGRLQVDGKVVLDGIDLPPGYATGLDRIWITACGTAYHAGLAGKEVLETLLRVPVDVVYAHELRYRDPLIRPGDLAVAISQSGETVDTLVAARLAQAKGARLLAITNVVGSTISREADDVLYTRAGPEIAVASTKAYLTQLCALYLLAIKFGLERAVLSPGRAAALAERLLDLPRQAAELLERAGEAEAVARRLAASDDVYFIGRGLDHAVAMEGSLKFKEISYIHSEAMPAGELKHGTLALVTDETPVVSVVTQQHVYDKSVSAIQEVQARGAYTIAVAYDDDGDIGRYADEVLGIPRTADLLSAPLAAIPLQLLAYYTALERGHDIDQPRNLAKSVTVE